MTLFTDQIKIFQLLSGERFRYILPLSKFRKLSEIPFMKSKSFVKEDYDILYKKIQVSSDKMDFYGFLEAIEYIAKKLNAESYAYNKKHCLELLIAKLLKYFQ